MKIISSPWQRVVRLGTSGVFGLERTQIMMVNGLSAGMIVVVSAFLTFYVASGIDKWPNWLPAYPLFFLVLVLNGQGRIKAGRMIFFWGCLALIFSWCMLNRRNGAEYGLIALGVSSTMVFRKRRSVYFGAFSAVSLILVYKVYDSIVPFTPNPTFDYNVVPNLIFSAAVIIVFLEVMAFRELAGHYYKKLSTKYKILEDTITAKKKVEEELNVANEELRTSNESLNSLTGQLDQIVKQKSIELQSYLDAININIYSAVTDIQGTIVTVNDPLVKVTGFSKDELVGNNFRLLNSGYHDREFYKNLYRQLTNGETWRGETKNKNKDGSLFWIDQVILPVKNENGVLRYFLMLALPITERKEMEEQRAKAMQILESITHRASHDIRGPLARMMGLSTLLERELVKEDELGYVARSLLLSSHELDNAIHELTAFIANNHKLFAPERNGL